MKTAVLVLFGVVVMLIAALVGVTLYVFDYKSNPKRVKQ